MRQKQEPVSYEDFIAVYPEFQFLEQRAVCLKLCLAQELLRRSAWQGYWRTAVGLWTAHYLAVAYDISDGLAEAGKNSPTASIGVSNSRSASTTGLSESMAVSALVTSADPFEADLARTEYGLELLTLLKLVIPAGGVVYSADASSGILDKRYSQ